MRTHLGDQLQLKRSKGKRAASYGGGGATTAREDQDNVREREKKKVRRACNFNANLENKLTVTEGCPIGSMTPASPCGIQAATMARSEQGRQLRHPRAGVEKRCGAGEAHKGAGTRGRHAKGRRWRGRMHLAWQRSPERRRKVEDGPDRETQPVSSRERKGTRGRRPRGLGRRAEWVAGQRCWAKEEGSALGQLRKKQDGPRRRAI